MINKSRPLNKETAKAILNIYIDCIKDDVYSRREIAAEPKEFRLKYLQTYFDENFNIETILDEFCFYVAETEGCCGVGQLYDMNESASLVELEVQLRVSLAHEFSLLKYYSTSSKLTAKLKELGFVVDRVWYNSGSGNKVTELTYDTNKSGAWGWPNFSDIQAALGAEAVTQGLSTLMDQSSASPAKTTKRRRSALV